jgi:hypothetical protein
LTEQGDQFPSKIVWNKVVFDSFEAGYLRSIDYNLYIKLRHSIGRRLYRFLSKRMYFGPDLTFDLNDLAFAHVGLSQTYSGNAGKIKEKLQPAIDELEAVGFLEPMAREQRYHKDGKAWKIRFTAKNAPADPASPSPAKPSPLVSELTERGVTKATAAELVQQHPAETIQLKIEVFDWLLERKDTRIAKSPEGYLVKSIRDDYKPPKGFTSKAERERQGEAERQRRQAEAEKTRQRHEEHRQRARHQAVRKRVIAYWEGLSSEQQSQLEADALAQAEEEHRARYLSPDTALFRRTLILDLIEPLVLPILQAEGKLPLEA